MKERPQRAEKWNLCLSNTVVFIYVSIIGRCFTVRLEAGT
jgi:hypothetical protein